MACTGVLGGKGGQSGERRVEEEEKRERQSQGKGKGEGEGAEDFQSIHGYQAGELFVPARSYFVADTQLHITIACLLAVQSISYLFAVELIGPLR